MRVPRPMPITTKAIELAIRFHSTSRVRPVIRKTSQPTVPNGERSEEHTSELQSQSNLVCRLLLEKKNAKPHSPLLLTHCRWSNPRLRVYFNHSSLRITASRISPLEAPRRPAHLPATCRPTTSGSV